MAIGWAILPFPHDTRNVASTTSTTTANKNTGIGESTLPLPSSSGLASMIPTMPFGAPATNATIPPERSLLIEEYASLLEEQNIGSGGDPRGFSTTTTNNAESSKLSGSWRLLYSNAPEIVGLARGLPLGFRLGPTYQPLDTRLGFFENTARLEHPYRLASLETIVVGRVRPSAIGSLNAVGVENNKNNRVDIEFELIIFQVDELLGKALEEPIRRTLVPNKKKTASSDEPSRATAKQSALPANDQTYLDQQMRIVRGGDGSLFVFSRDNDTASRMKTASERETLFASVNKNKKFSLVEETPLGEELEIAEQQTDDTGVPAEIQFLFKDRTKKGR
ncbi:unnamed protein product [Pseudo-nitzschia multistriata]|uniref:Plastid lipid-associated protein/fibrillin conserved domain-containing protein n=1 Tax=Pseudo-nitzschia multistriata TaxID=183589 RepID=A0A448ZQE4_9STRA|nr:unnamed protein product [Pseudo-nitzschia multistriata]